MKRILAVLILALLGCGISNAQHESYDVFIPISKYFAQGDTKSLSAWFGNNLEISILSKSSTSSRSQARQVLSSFFSSHTPRSFEITHTASRGKMKYALGTLNAGGEIYLVTFFVSQKDKSYQIQQLKIDRID